MGDATLIKDALQIAHITADLQILARPVGMFCLDDQNAREGHDLEGIAQSIDQYGQLKPIVASLRDVDEKGRHKILAGNGTFLAITTKLGYAYIAAVLVDGTEDEGAAYAIADNRLNDKSRFNMQQLAKLVNRLNTEKHSTGFSENQLEKLRTAYNGRGATPKQMQPPVQRGGDGAALITCPRCNHRFEAS